MAGDSPHPAFSAPSSDPRAYDYAPYYCEENIYRMLSRPEFSELEAYALFIFGTAGRVAVFNQRGGDAERGGLALWDYHVAALVGTPLPGAHHPASGLLCGGPAYRASRRVMFDFDTSGPFSSSAGEYLERSFGPFSRNRNLYPFRPLFRLVPAAVFVERFDSDRSHMRDGEGRYAAPPPPWPRPTPKAEGLPLPLSQLIDPASSLDGLGIAEPFDLERFRAFLERSGKGEAAAER